MHTHTYPTQPPHTLLPFSCPQPKAAALHSCLWLILREGGQGASYHPASSPGTGLTTPSSFPLGFELCPRLCPQVITLPYPTCSSLPPQEVGAYHELLLAVERSTTPGSKEPARVTELASRSQPASSGTQTLSFLVPFAWFPEQGAWGPQGKS